MDNNIDFNSLSGAIGKEVPHLYFMTGLLWEISKNANLQPQILLKYAQNTPLDADLNLSLIFIEKLTLGLTYRIGGSSVNGAGESLDLLFAIQASEQFLLGFSYDITLSELKSHSSGSLEAVVRLCLEGKKGEAVNPRFF